MKKHLLMSVFLVATASASGNTPEIIEPKTKIIRSISWYTEQASLWHDRVRENPSPDGWLNYYAAARYAVLSKADLDRIAEEVQTAIGGTFEATVVKGWNEGFTDSGFSQLKKAFDMNPGHAATYSSLAFFFELKGHREDKKAFEIRLLEQGQVSQALMSYSYNVLMSVEDGAVLISEGDNATLPLFILQDVMNVRRDVVVLNLDLLNHDGYARRKLSEAGLNILDFDQWSLAADRKKYLCAELPAQNPRRKFYYALTLGRENISSIKDQLYVVGLASQISKDRLDNISIIKKNLENRFLLDYLSVDFNGESDFAAGKAFSSNYLLPMLLLDGYYWKSGEKDKAERLEQVISRLAAAGGKMELVDQFLGREKLLPEFIQAPIDVKELEEHFRVIRNNLYAMNEEVTNRQYNSFIDFLISSHQNDLYEKCRVDLSKYEGTSLAFFKGYHTYIKEPGKGRSRDPFGKYPVINISHEAAVAYCEWLTEQYNHAADKKYRRVKFRLPTLNEWQIAALGYEKFQSWELDQNTVPVMIPKDPTAEIGKKGKPATIPVTDVSYPWYGSYNYRNKVQNHFNCFLANIKAPEDCKPCKMQVIGKDGFSMMAPVGAYFPNNIGLYDVVGNVAEMVDVNGKACGGSWDQSPEESTIRSVSEYKGPDATVGFRIFMEVIEN